MMTVHEVSELTSLSVRALRYYDSIGLLCPSERTEAGYRLYSDADLKRLQRILLYRAVGFSLGEIKTVLADASLDRTALLEQQIKLLELKKEHIENLIALARGIKLLGEDYMDLRAFDTKKLDEYAARAKENWGQTDAYREFEQKAKGRTKEKEQALGAEMMAIFAEFGAIRSGDPAGTQAQQLVKKLQDHISSHYYNCTDTILLGLGKMYAAGGEFTENIDRFGGEGTAAFAAKAIEVKCGR